MAYLQIFIIFATTFKSITETLWSLLTYQKKAISTSSILKWGDMKCTDVRQTPRIPDTANSSEATNLRMKHRHLHSAAITP